VREDADALGALDEDAVALERGLQVIEAEGSSSLMNRLTIRLEDLLVGRSCMSPPTRVQSGWKRWPEM
jgi:hypothetical protein